ncbi:hypothetical protein ACMGDH_03885 [Sphingomonas sp. DT-207]|uniref:hypothetical protein n=1 Tax=Sphingomonas sp. DT-207 TaxID=3396167 RepID=UPI003F1CD5DD
MLAGDGTVDLTADIATTNRAALTVTAAALVPGTGQGSTQALTIVNRGTLSGTITDYFSNAFGVVQLGMSNTLQNEGTIRAAYTATNGGTPSTRPHHQSHRRHNQRRQWDRHSRRGSRRQCWHDHR